MLILTFNDDLPLEITEESYEEVEQSSEKELRRSYQRNQDTTEDITEEIQQLPNKEIPYDRRSNRDNVIVEEEDSLDNGRRDDSQIKDEERIEGRPNTYYLNTEEKEDFAANQDEADKQEYRSIQKTIYYDHIAQLASNYNSLSSKQSRTERENLHSQDNYSSNKESDVQGRIVESRNSFGFEEGIDKKVDSKTKVGGVQKLSDKGSIKDASIGGGQGSRKELIISNFSSKDSDLNEKPDSRQVLHDNVSSKKSLTNVTQSVDEKIKSNISEAPIQLQNPSFKSVPKEKQDGSRKESNKPSLIDGDLSNTESPNRKVSKTDSSQPSIDLSKVEENVDTQMKDPISLQNEQDISPGSYATRRSEVLEKIHVVTKNANQRANRPLMRHYSVAAPGQQGDLNNDESPNRRSLRYPMYNGMPEEGVASNSTNTTQPQPSNLVVTGHNLQVNISNQSEEFKESHNIRQESPIIEDTTNKEDQRRNIQRVNNDSIEKIGPNQYRGQLSGYEKRDEMIINSPVSAISNHELKNFQTIDSDLYRQITNTKKLSDDEVGSAVDRIMEKIFGQPSPIKSDASRQSNIDRKSFNVPSDNLSRLSESSDYSRNSKLQNSLVQEVGNQQRPALQNYETFNNNLRAPSPLKTVGGKTDGEWNLNTLPINISISLQEKFKEEIKASNDEILPMSSGGAYTINNPNNRAQTEPAKNRSLLGELSFRKYETDKNENQFVQPSIEPEDPQATTVAPLSSRSDLMAKAPIVKKIQHSRGQSFTDNGSSAGPAQIKEESAGLRTDSWSQNTITRETDPDFSVNGSATKAFEKVYAPNIRRIDLDKLPEGSKKYVQSKDDGVDPSNKGDRSIIKNDSFYQRLQEVPNEVAREKGYQKQKVDDDLCEIIMLKLDLLTNGPNNTKEENEETRRNLDSKLETLFKQRKGQDEAFKRQFNEKLDLVVQQRASNMGKGNLIAMHQDLLSHSQETQRSLAGLNDKLDLLLQRHGAVSPEFNISPGLGTSVLHSLQSPLKDNKIRVNTARSAQENDIYNLGPSHKHSRSEISIIDQANLKPMQRDKLEAIQEKTTLTNLSHNRSASQVFLSQLDASANNRQEPYSGASTSAEPSHAVKVALQESLDFIERLKGLKGDTSLSFAQSSAILSKKEEAKPEVEIFKKGNLTINIPTQSTIKSEKDLEKISELVRPANIDEMVNYMSVASDAGPLKTVNTMQPRSKELFVKNQTMLDQLQYESKLREEPKVPSRVSYVSQEKPEKFKKTEDNLVSTPRNRTSSIRSFTPTPQSRAKYFEDSPEDFEQSKAQNMTNSSFIVVDPQFITPLHLSKQGSSMLKQSQADNTPTEKQFQMKTLPTEVLNQAKEARGSRTPQPRKSEKVDQSDSEASSKNKWRLIPSCTMNFPKREPEEVFLRKAGDNVLSEGKSQPYINTDSVKTQSIATEEVLNTKYGSKKASDMRSNREGSYFTEEDIGSFENLGTKSNKTSGEVVQMSREGSLPRAMTFAKSTVSSQDTYKNSKGSSPVQPTLKSRLVGTQEVRPQFMEQTKSSARTSQNDISTWRRSTSPYEISSTAYNNSSINTSSPVRYHKTAVSPYRKSNNVVQEGRLGTIKWRLELEDTSYEHQETSFDHENVPDSRESRIASEVSDAHDNSRVRRKNQGPTATEYPYKGGSVSAGKEFYGQEQQLHDKILSGSARKISPFEVNNLIEEYTGVRRERNNNQRSNDNIKIISDREDYQAYEGPDSKSNRSYTNKRQSYSGNPKMPQLSVVSELLSANQTPEDGSDKNVKRSVHAIAGEGKVYPSHNILTSNESIYTEEQEAPYYDNKAPNKYGMSHKVNGNYGNLRGKKLQ